MAPKRYVQLDPVSVGLFGKRVFADGIKYHKMRSSWIIWVGPKPNVLREQTDRRKHTETEGGRPNKEESKDLP